LKAEIWQTNWYAEIYNTPDVRNACAINPADASPEYNGTTRSGRIPVATRYKAWVCGRSFAGIAGWNTAGDMNVFLL
jgi:hypothetical protein